MSRFVFLLATVFAVMLAVAPSLSHATPVAPYVLTAAPTANAAEMRKMYTPIAVYLAKITGHRFMVRYPTGWLQYEEWVRDNKADVYFDGSHFASWRTLNQGATFGPRIPQTETFVLFTWRGNSSVHALGDTYGRRLCEAPPPSLSGLWINGYYDNPARLPRFVAVLNGKDSVAGVIAKKCDLGVATVSLINGMDPQHKHFQVILQSRKFLGPTFTFSAALPSALAEKINAALLGPAGQAATATLRNQFEGAPLVKATPEEYTAASQGLTHYWSALFFPKPAMTTSK